MDKRSWRKVLALKGPNCPGPRWGHSSAIVGEDIVFFGGYSDSIYMNDLWTFNTSTMAWAEIHATGAVPSLRSNCSLNYDSANNRLILFGGGGPNKARSNCIYLLDWTTKHWTELAPNPSEPAPLERTYHSAEYLAPYLVVFGGESIIDLNDLWLYNFETSKWEQLQVANAPCPRRFHTSALIGTEFFVIAGCYAKYRSLNDVYKLDLGPLLEGLPHELQWEEVRPKGTSFLSRWGHSTAVYDGKAYIFGGRFSSDLNDVLVFDPLAGTLTSLKVGGEAPKPRRRNSAVFVGSSMVVFGGYNGDYFNDFHYFDVFSPKSPHEPLHSAKSSSLGFLASSNLSDAEIVTKDGERVPVHRGLIAPLLADPRNVNGFIEKAQRQLESETLVKQLAVLYSGEGRLSAEMEALGEFEINDSQLGWEQQLGRRVGPVGKGKFKGLPVVGLSDEDYSSFLERRAERFLDCTLVVNGEYVLGANRALLASRSKYFAAVFGKAASEVAIRLPVDDVAVFDILLNFLELGVVVIPLTCSHRLWCTLLALAHFFCLHRLYAICECVLVGCVASSTLDELFTLGLLHHSEWLALTCAEFVIRNFMDHKELECNELSASLADKKTRTLHDVFTLLRFHLDQTHLDKENPLPIKAPEEAEIENNENVLV